MKAQDLWKLSRRAPIYARQQLEQVKGATTHRDVNHTLRIPGIKAAFQVLVGNEDMPRPRRKETTMSTKIIVVALLAAVFVNALFVWKLVGERRLRPQLFLRLFLSPHIGFQHDPFAHWVDHGHGVT